MGSHTKIKYTLSHKCTHLTKGCTACCAFQKKNSAKLFKALIAEQNGGYWKGQHLDVAKSWMSDV